MKNEVEEQNPFEFLSDEELKASETELLREAGSRGGTSDEEYERHYEYIRRVRKSNDSTHKRFTKRSVYSDDRAELHEKLLSEELDRASSVPREGKAVFVGGMTGAGKSSILRRIPEFQDNRFAVANPDSIKLRMIDFSMAPHIPGLLPLETDELIRYEASILDSLLLERFMALRTNVVIDRTMGSIGQMRKLRSRLSDFGYSSVEGVFVDIDPELAYERIRARHRGGLDRYLTGGGGVGERPVPGTAVRASRPLEGSSFLTANAEVFNGLVIEEAFTEAPKIFRGETGESMAFEELQTSVQ